MIHIALAAVGAIACVGWCWQRARGLARLRRDAPNRELIRQARLGRERLSDFLSHVRPTGPAADLARAWCSASNQSQAVADLNERSQEIAYELSRVRMLTRAVGRLCFAWGAFLALLSLIEELRALGNVAIAGVPFAIGFAGAGVCWALGQRAAVHAQAVRDAWNSLIRAFRGSLASS